MTNLREQMRQVIQQGIDGWIDAQFTGDNQPADSLTDYPLKRESVIVYYHSKYSYQAIENTFLDYFHDETELDTILLQAWIDYHWQYAYLELAERFDVLVIELTEDMKARRKVLRDEIISQGFKQIKL